MKVMKFGGTSVKDASRIRDMVKIVSRENLSEGLVVVCSAMKGITDDLIRAARQAESGEAAYAAVLDAIWQRQENAMAELFATGTATSGTQTSTTTTTAKTADIARDARTDLAAMFHEMQEICHGILLIRECSLRSLDLMMSFGERLNNRLIAAYLQSLGYDAWYVDARDMVLTDTSFGGGMVDFARTNYNIQMYFNKVWGGTWKGRIALVTGFVGATADGITTTLGRNGSDYTGAIFGAALDVSDIEIWTDVDGVLSADPRVVKKAFVIPELSVEEAMEMCYFGAEVLHPYTIIPAVEKKIPIWIKNTMNPATRGTRIATDVPPGGHIITGLASIKNVSLINIQGGGLMGSKGIASRIFAALAKADANIIMISQASSEHSICVVLRDKEAHHALRALQHELKPLIQSKLISSVELVGDMEIVAVIGANMRGKPGVSGKLFGALGASGINVHVIAQGSSEMNISFVIEQRDHERALNSLHAAFFPEL
jgi:aspartokinase/homoserine dehydrogenase 1